MCLYLTLYCVRVCKCLRVGVCVGVCGRMYMRACVWSFNICGLLLVRQVIGGHFPGKGLSVVLRGCACFLFCFVYVFVVFVCCANPYLLVLNSFFSYRRHNHRSRPCPRARWRAAVSFWADWCHHRVETPDRDLLRAALAISLTMKVKQRPHFIRGTAIWLYP